MFNFYGYILLFHLYILARGILFSISTIQRIKKLKHTYCLLGYGLAVCQNWNSLNLLSRRRNKKNI